MQKNGFTFTEILIVLVLVGTLAGLGVNGFKHARAAHRIDSLLQELTLLRTAILSYKETYGCLPKITEGELSSSSFNVLKPFWYPFHPENSKVIKGGKWHGQINSNPNDSFLYLKPVFSSIFCFFFLATLSHLTFHFAE